MKKIFLIIAFLLPFFAHAEGKNAVPYFASLRSEIVNVRSGPSAKYPIKWRYQKKNYPVQVTSTFQQWRKLKDVEGESGWVHESLLSKKRFVLINGSEKILLRKTPNPTGLIVAEAFEKSVMELLSCKDNWCKLQNGDIKGFVESQYLWGIDENEVIE